MRPRPPRASTPARVLRETVTALTLEPTPHGGPEVAKVIAELLLEIGFFACDDAVADDNKRGTKNARAHRPATATAISA